MLSTRIFLKVITKSRSPSQCALSRTFCQAQDLKETKLSQAFERVAKLIHEKKGITKALNSHQKELIKGLCRDGGRLDDAWAHAISSNPSLLNVKLGRMRSIIQELQYYGGTTDEIATFFEGTRSTFITNNHEAIVNNIYPWVAFSKLHKVKWMEVLCSAPYVILVHPEIWNERVAQLQPTFHACMGTLLTESPNVLLETPENLQQKINLFQKEMNVSAKSMAVTGALNYDYDHIRTRYMLLNRAGLYKHPSARTVGMTARAQPLIDKILEGSDEKFLRRTTSSVITEQDYKTFKEVLRTENEVDEFLEEKADDLT